jgi:dipeptidyl aminopeptidase/acylaminoacyl peptidase
MKRILFSLISLVFIAGCEFAGWPPTSNSAERDADNPRQTLIEARRGHSTKLIKPKHELEPVADPPRQLFRVVRYTSPAGKLAAYVSQPPKNGKRLPAIVWVFGGFDNGIGPTAWTDAPAKNDQSASAFRKAGIVMMYPSLRGGNDNPGRREGLYGEVEDVLAAGEYLARQDFVDPNRIYLGGHSTGGTLAMLVAACPNPFRAIFSLGPVDDVASYGPEELPFDIANRKERELRAPRRWLDAMQTPLFVFEGTKEPTNLRSLQIMARASRNKLIQFHPVPNTDHFSVIAPLTRLVARKVVSDTEKTPGFSFTEEELAALGGSSSSR